MQTYKVVNLAGRSLRFRGTLITTVKSAQIETTGGSVWFELSAYDRDPSQFVLTISARRSDSEIDEVFDFYSAASITAAEDFLYDFDPSLILPKDILAAAGPRPTPAIVTADRAYYAAARRLIRELSDHISRRERGPERESAQAQPSAHPAAESAPLNRGKIANRIRHLLGVWMHGLRTRSTAQLH